MIAVNEREMGLSVKHARKRPNHVLSELETCWRSISLSIIEKNINLIENISFRPCEAPKIQLCQGNTFFFMIDM